MSEALDLNNETPSDYVPNPFEANSGCGSSPEANKAMKIARRRGRSPLVPIVFSLALGFGSFGGCQGGDGSNNGSIVDIPTGPQNNSLFNPIDEQDGEQRGLKFLEDSHNADVDSYQRTTQGINAIEDDCRKDALQALFTNCSASGQ